MSGRRGSARKPGRSGFTLAELVMAIAVLALAGVFLAQVFLSADRIATKSSDLDHAVSLCTTVVEEWKASADPRAIDRLLTFPEWEFQFETPGDIHFSGWLAPEMSPTVKTMAKFAYNAVAVQDGDLLRLTISISYVGDDKPLYSLVAARWAPAPVTK